MSEGNVIDWRGAVTNVDIAPERILKGAAEIKFNLVLVLGWDEDDELRVCCSTGDVAEVLLLIEKVKMELLRNG